ncbi:MAG: hypothetical protein GAK30_02447 [Paracidovorax wautersii]|uniref:Uncharacterized protein n=1 Tax=Paracidovorax wautersii TaxID=1177982 RepID=A0A7V8JQ04_9BURK|nr:MAG: hypothetical protein GAK30_02447 [Paracidovorax wautersii]
MAHRRLQPPGASALQMVLDLFDRRAPAAPDPAIADQAPTASVTPATFPPTPTASVPPPAAPPAAAPYPVHPQANRRIALDGQPVAYAFVRARRRTIGFLVDAQGPCARRAGP